MSIREIIYEIQREVRDSDLQPDRAAELLIKLSALLGNCNDAIRERDMEYARKVMDIKRDVKSVAEAKLVSETIKEYQDRQEARHVKELTEEMIKSLKYYLRSKAEEYNL